MAQHTRKRAKGGDGAARLVTNLPTAASVLRRHAERGRAALTHALLRALPRSVETPIGRAVGRVDPVAGLLAQERERGSEHVSTLLQDLAEHGDADMAVRCADALVALHRPVEARAVLDGPARGGRGRDVVLASVLAEAGQLGEAIRGLRGVGGPAARLQRTRLQGELAALDASRRLDGGGAPRPRATHGPVRGVLHLATTALPTAQSGYTIRTHAIATHQLRAGLRSDVVSRVGFPVDQGHPLARRCVDVDGVIYHRLLPHGPMPRSAGARLDLAVDLADQLVQDIRPDLLHAHSKHENAQVAVAVARRHGLPVVYEVRGFLEETWRSRGGDADSDFYRLSRQAELDCMAAADQVVTLSRSMRDHIVAGGIAAEKVHLVPNAVPDSFLRDVPVRSEARRSLGWDDSVRVIGFCGTVNPYEGLDVVVEALLELDDPTLRLLVVGSGPALAEVRRMAAPLGDRARFTGRLPHPSVRQHIAAMDLFVVPRRDTPVTRLVPPLKHLEAMASSVPVLLSDLPPLRETADESGAALLAPPEDPDAWGLAITQALAHPEALRDREERGVAWIRDERCWSRVAERYRVVYETASRAR